MTKREQMLAAVAAQKAAAARSPEADFRPTDQPTALKPLTVRKKVAALTIARLPHGSGVSAMWDATAGLWRGELVVPDCPAFAATHPGQVGAMWELDALYREYLKGKPATGEVK